MKPKKGSDIVQSPSLLAQALEASPSGKQQKHEQQQQQQQQQQPSYLPRQDSVSSAHSNSYTMNAKWSYNHEPFIPVHSDFTIPTSNVSDIPPPESVSESQQNRRSLFGGRVKERYGYLDRPQHQPPSIRRWSSSDDDNSSSLMLHLVPVHASTTESTAEYVTSSLHGPLVETRQLSDMTPPSSPNRSRQHLSRDMISPITPYENRRNNRAKNTPISKNKQRRMLHAHETVHAQSLLLGIAFMAIWSPQNLMAPNLTEMAKVFGFTTDQERDVYLGANLALASGVLSLPISAGIGFLADVCNRKHLFCVTVIAGGITSWATGASTSYNALFLARLLNGGFMSGSVPIVFSLLSDLFATNERNTASSGLTAMMGMGIIFGQVYAGVVGSEQGWSHAFTVSAIVTLVSALLVIVFVKEPVRGGKEDVLQHMLKHGTKYERTLTWKGFLHAMQNNQSNVILMWQGFASSVPWGIIFVFLNDYLSQERGFSVPDATYLVAVFGVGCAMGGILGGYWGQLILLQNRSYLPWFMAVTTFLGIFPFLFLLNGHFTNAHGVGAILNAFMGGLIASLPSVNVRPCLINVNPPETRGAALTAANLIINVARGAGPSCITLMGALFQVNRQCSFNVTVCVMICHFVFINVPPYDLSTCDLP